MRGSKLPRGAAGVAVVLLLAGCATPRKQAGAPSAGSCAQLNGVWEGELTLRSSANAADPSGGKGTRAGDSLKLRLAFAGDGVRVHERDKRGWSAAMPDEFSVRCQGPSAVAHAIGTGRDEDGTWVESWVISVTVHEHDELFAHWSRMVNNVDLPASAAGSRFTSNALGVLRRAETPPGCEVPDGPEADGKETVDEFLTGRCRCGNADPCLTLALLLEREGGAENVARAAALATEACRLGLQEACSAPARQVPPRLIRTDARPVPTTAFGGLEGLSLGEIVERLGPARREVGAFHCILAWPATDGREFFVATLRCDPAEKAVHARF